MYSSPLPVFPFSSYTCIFLQYIVNALFCHLKVVSLFFSTPINRLPRLTAATAAVPLPTVCMPIVLPFVCWCALVPKKRCKRRVHTGPLVLVDSKKGQGCRHT